MKTISKNGLNKKLKIGYAGITNGKRSILVMSDKGTTFEEVTIGQLNDAK